MTPSLTMPRGLSLRVGIAEPGAFTASPRLRTHSRRLITSHILAVPFVLFVAVQNVSGNLSGMQDKSSYCEDKLYAAKEMADHVKRLATPIEEGANVKSRIAKAASALGFSWERTKKLWYQELKSIPTELSDFIRAKAEAHDKTLRKNMSSAAAAMWRSDPEFYHHDIEAVRELLLQGRGEAGAGGVPDRGPAADAAENPSDAVDCCLRTGGDDCL